MQMTLEELEKRKFDTGQAILSAIEHGGEVPFVAYKDYCIGVAEAREAMKLYEGGDWTVIDALAAKHRQGRMSDPDNPEVPLEYEQAKASTAAAVNQLSDICHNANINWWSDPATGIPTQRNVGELLMLCVSELSEAMEGHRKDLMDDKLPHRKMIEVELADCLIRIFDMGGGLGLDLGGALVEKMEYNAQRADHKVGARLAPGGKKY